jgi:hypothetical protein
MLVTIHDAGSLNGGISWSNPRYDDCTPTDLDDWTPEERGQFVDAIVEQVSAWPHRPSERMTYEFAVRETWRQTA